MLDSKSEVITLEYPKAAFYKRVFAFLFDFLCAVFLATGIAALGSLGLQQVSLYKNALETMNSIEIESGMYIENGSSVDVITDFYTVSSSSAGDADYQIVDDQFENALVSFYNSSYFFPDNQGNLIYQKLKVGDSSLTYDVDGVSTSYWKLSLDSSGSSVIVKNCDYATLYDFYQTAISDDALPAISVNSLSYISASKTIFWLTFGLILGSFVFAMIVFFFLIPLFFRRGWQTFGKRLFKLSLINAKAVSPSWKQYLSRSLLLLFIEFTVGFFSFAIPIFVSFTMFAIRKDGQSFHDYVAGTYVVDSSQNLIYFSESEYEKRNGDLGMLSIENGTELIHK
jgi:uncharacterized RDD family membrane protein YckC